MGMQLSPLDSMQHTLDTAVSWVGVGLHSGRAVSMTLRPAPEDTGILFVRKDVPLEQGVVAARWYNTVHSELSTVIRNRQGISVATIEHLLAALRAAGVDNVVVELDGPEVPIMDGSAEPFLTMLRQAGTRTQVAPRKVIWIRRPLVVREDDRFAVLMPDSVPRLTVSIDFPSKAIGSQVISLPLGPECIERKLCAARTFGFAHEVEQLRSRGLALGGSLRNAVVLEGDRVLNEEGLRFADEFVRHKALDCVGDLALAGARIIGHLYTHKPGHRLNARLLEELFAERDAWSYLPATELAALTGDDAQSNVSRECEASVAPMSQLWAELSA